jgi:glycosyltransferase involved in cell wall biosynthesis
MKTMVFGVPAVTGGALTILKQHHSAAMQDIDNEWIFIVSTPHLPDQSNITVVNYPWVKKSWFHRLYFDRYVAPKLVKDHGVDQVLSLQNITLPKVKVPQILYLQQALPFADKRYRFSESSIYWIYQNIIGRRILQSIKEADRIIVQSHWFKDTAAQRAKVDPGKFTVKFPELDIKVKQAYRNPGSEKVIFFYPSGADDYKNHKLVVEALQHFSKAEMENFKIVFTLDGNENKRIAALFNAVETNNLPVEFVGRIPIDEVYQYYSKSILLFPSFIETLGLPLLEAKAHQAPILASNCAFSLEILKDYPKALFFHPFKVEELISQIRYMMSQK